MRILECNKFQVLWSKKVQEKVKIEVKRSLGLSLLKTTEFVKCRLEKEKHGCRNMRQLGFIVNMILKTNGMFDGIDRDDH